ncbi:MAG TPA: hypothetical protein VN132_09260 [Bdellovibrio sp.]|nr:hypothetical protein [Bdellovibrio sp.]
MRLFIILLITLSSALGLAKNSLASKAEDANDLVQYLSTFKTLNEVLTDYKLIGILSETDSKEISAFLKMQKIDIDQPLPKILAKGDNILFGKKFWSYKNDQGYITTNGLYVRPRKEASSSELFEQMFRIQMNQTAWSHGARFSFILTAAHAEPSILIDGLSIDAATSALGYVGNVVIGSTTMGAMRYVNSLRSFFYDQHVKCENGDYIVTSKNDSIYELLNQKVDEWSLCRQRTMFVEQTQVACRKTSAGLIYLNKFFTPEEKTASINQLLKSAFAGSNPNCTPARAEKVDRILKEHLKKEMVRAGGDSASKAPAGQVLQPMKAIN